MNEQPIRRLPGPPRAARSGTGVALPYRQAPRRVLVCHGTVTQAPLTVLRVATKTI